MNLMNQRVNAFALQTNTISKPSIIDHNLQLIKRKKKYYK